MGRTTWIALLRGINVGGKNILPMKDLRGLLEELGYLDVRTYIQSGNCVFKAESGSPNRISKEIADRIDQKFGFRPRILVMTVDDLSAALGSNPYPQGANDPKTVHLFFLSEPADNADVDAMCRLCSGGEAFTIGQRVIYLHAPNGLGKSKLADKLEKLAGVPATARNLRSASRIADLARSL